MDKLLEQEIQMKNEKSSLFQNEQFLSLDFIPNNVPFREDKIKHLFNYFKPIFNSSNENFLVT